VIGVYTDDLLNYTTSLQLLTGKKVVPWPASKLSSATLGPYVYVSENLDILDAQVYKKLVEAESTLVIINPVDKSSFMFMAGELPTPQSMVSDYLKEFTLPEDVPAIVQALRGLSLKAASEIVQLTMARVGSLALPEIRRTRTMVGGAIQGLQVVDTDLDFYLYPEKLEQWLKLNGQYFLTQGVPDKLVPRGLMLAGAPGVGKSTAAKAIANHWQVPLFRLDIATTLNKYIGESESRVARSLNMLERESPCVVLIDEAEKIFGGQDDSGVTARIMSQLLWWLSDHRSRVITVMTTNDLKVLPVELYRPGRLDLVLHIPKLSSGDAKIFAVKCFQSVMGKSPSMKQQQTLRQALEDQQQVEFSHSEVAETVYATIKQHHYLPAIDCK